MNDHRNLHIYRLWAPLYDTAFARLFARPRRRAIELLNLHPGERLLIPGVGTGLDLPHLPANVSVVGADFSPAMLVKARPKFAGCKAGLLVMNVQQLAFPKASFDAALLNLILSVVPDGAAAFGQVWRVLKPGGRVVIFDKFLPEGAVLTPGRRWLGQIVRALGTDPNRRLSEIIGGAPGLTIERDEPGLLQGQYRILRLKKE